MFSVTYITKGSFIFVMLNLSGFKSFVFSSFSYFYPKFFAGTLYQSRFGTLLYASMVSRLGIVQAVGKDSPNPRKTHLTAVDTYVITIFQVHH